MKNLFLLDMDETLLDFRRTERENFFATFSDFGIPVSDEVFARFHEINDGLWNALERGEVARGEILTKRFELLFEEYRIAAPVETVAQAFFRNYEHICHPYDGAAEFLRTLSSRGKVWIVTNGAAVIQKRHIADAGFAPYLSGVFISEEVGYNKPDVRFARCVEAGIADYKRENAVWLGDSLTSDCTCAERAGIDFVLYAPAGAPEGYAGDAARDYAEALRLFDRM